MRVGVGVGVGERRDLALGPWLNVTYVADSR